MYKLQWKLNRNSYIFIPENAFENVIWKTAAILSQPHFVNSVAPGDVIWYQRTWSTSPWATTDKIFNVTRHFIEEVLSDTVWPNGNCSTVVWVMASCLMALRPYQKHCWLIINKGLCNSGSYIGNDTPSVIRRYLEIELAILNYIWSSKGT